MHQGETRGSTVTFEKERQNKAVLHGASSAPMILDSSSQIIFLLGQVPSFLETGAKLKFVFNPPPRTILKIARFSYYCSVVLLFSFLWNEPSLNAGGLQLSCFLRSHCYFWDSTVVDGSLLPQFSPTHGHRECSVWPERAEE